MMAELGKNAPVYSLLSQIKNYQILKLLRYSAIFYERKSWNLVLLDHSCTIYFLFNFFIYSILGTENALFIFNLDRGWRESSLASLAEVLWCLVRVGVI